MNWNDTGDEDVPDERTCPVCRQAAHNDGARIVRFPSFTAMMRHWGAEHPKAVPSGDLAHDNGRGHETLGQRLKSIEPQDDINAWADDLEAHLDKVREVWDALGYAA